MVGAAGAGCRGRPGPQARAAAPAVASFPALTEWRAAWGRVALYGWNLRAGWPPTLAPHHWDSGQILLGSLLGLLVWGTAGWVGWSAARRENPWGALTAVVGTAALNTYYSAEGWSFLVVVLALGLLWAGDSALCRLQDRWPTDSLYPGLGFDWWLSSGAVMLAATAVMGVSVWVTDPALGQWVDDLLHPAQVAAPGEGEGIAAASAPANAAPFMGVWPREHLLGAGPDLLNAPVMSVQTPDLPPTHLYWRATSYDEYTGQGWIQNSASSLAPDAAPLWPASITPPPGFALVRQVVRLQGQGRQIYAAGRPVSLNLPAEGTWLDPEALDLIGVRSVVAQSGYEVLSWVPGATPDDLRSAPQMYPVWVTNSYLSLPDELPQRVIDLAHSLTAGQPTVYDQALALQTYLRTIPYTLDLPAPSTDADVVDSFLFDLKRGYCDYYASAMVVMARSVDIPARLAVGYAAGSYDARTQSYRVIQADAHSWVEVYFPGNGWIPFEPTAAYPEPVRGLPADWDVEAASAQVIAAWQAEQLAGTKPAWLRSGWLPAAASGIGALMLAVVAGGAIRKRRLARGTPAEIVDRLYGLLVAYGRRLGVALSRTQTPDEFLTDLVAALAAQVDHAPRLGVDWTARRSNAEQAAQKLVSLVVRQRYSPHQPARSDAHALLAAWPRLDRSLRLFWLARLAGWIK